MPVLEEFENASVENDQITEDTKSKIDPSLIEKDATVKKVLKLTQTIPTDDPIHSTRPDSHRDVFLA